MDNARKIIARLFLFAIVAAVALWSARLLARHNGVRQQQLVVLESSALFSGGLTARPSDFSRRCVQVRFRGSDNSWSVNEAIEYLDYHRFEETPNGINIGISFLEDPDGFVSLKDGFHLYHFLEFLVIAYEELHRLAVGSSGASRTHGLHVPWLNVPLFTREEICGKHSINCLILDLILQSGLARTGIYGLESNDNITQSIHEAYRGKLQQRSGDGWVPNTPAIQARHYKKMVSQVDAVLVIRRAQCIDEQRERWNLHKLWSNYIDSFPADGWHQNLLKGLIHSTSLESSSVMQRDKLIVGYIVPTGGSFPEAYDRWLVNYFGSHNKIHLLQLHMKNYTALEKIQLVKSCNVLVGEHGADLSHAMWMPPTSCMIELYWDVPFTWDYPTLSQLMNHIYLGFQNGQAIDSGRVSKRDVTLKSEMKEWLTTNGTVSIIDVIQQTEPVLEQFLMNAMNKLGI